MIPIVIGALGMVPKYSERGLEQLEIGGRIKTLETRASLRSTRILRRLLENRADFALDFAIPDCPGGWGL